MLKLYITVFNSLRQEKEIISHYINGPFLEVQQKMNSLKENVSKMLKDMYEIQQDHQKQHNKDDAISHIRLNFNNNHQKLSKFKSKYRAKSCGINSYVELKKKHLEVMERGSCSSKKNLEMKRVKHAITFMEILEDYNKVQNDVLDNHLQWWKIDQSKNGYGDESRLICIQNLCEDLAVNISLLKQIFVQISCDASLESKEREEIPGVIEQSLLDLKEKVYGEDYQRKLIGNLQPIKKEDLQTKLSMLFYHLVSSTFMVVKQPPQVLRTGSRFTTEVVSLVGTKIFEKTGTTSVTASILPCEEVAELTNPNIEKKNYRTNKWGEINNNIQTFENSARAKFQYLQLKSIKRTKANECVSEDLFSLIFHTKFECQGLEFQLWTPSLPMVVISHDSQRMKSNATIVWSNAGNHPFETQKELPWIQVFEALSSRWRQTCGKPLTNENSYFLACKAFQDNSIDPNELYNRTLSLAQFKRDNLPNSHHTFWEWFNSMMILTKQHLESMWKEGYVIGFISRLTANAMLEDSPEGTFLLRFSDSVLGGVTIGSRQLRSSTNNVRWLAPFTKGELAMRGIADMISDLTYLKTLYPNTPKTCIEKFKCESEKNKDGYLSIKLKCQIVPDDEDTNLLTSISPNKDDTILDLLLDADGFNDF